MRKALEFLKRPQAIEGRIRAALYKVDLCKSMAERITASLGGEQVSHTRNVTANENAIILLTEAHEKLEKLQMEYHDAPMSTISIKPDWMNWNPCLPPNAWTRLDELGQT